MFFSFLYLEQTIFQPKILFDHNIIYKKFLAAQAFAVYVLSKEINSFRISTVSSIYYFTSFLISYS